MKLAIRNQQPPQEPVVEFELVREGDGSIRVDALIGERRNELVRFWIAKKDYHPRVVFNRIYSDKSKEIMLDRKDSTYGRIHEHNL